MVEIHRTKPVAEGRYLAFTHAEGAKEWILPIVLLWHKGRWCFEYQQQPFPRKVYGRTDLLPVGRIEEVFPETMPQWSAEQIAAAEAQDRPGWWQRQPPLEYDL